MKYLQKPISKIMLVSIVILSGCSTNYLERTLSTETTDLTDNSNPNLTLTSQPSSIPSPTPAQEAVKIEIPFQEIIFEHVIVENEDGTYSFPFFEGDDGLYNQPEMPSYLWHINPYTEIQIKNIIVNFDIYETETERAYGLDRGVLVNLYNLNPIPDALNPGQDIVCRVCVLRNPTMGEWMERYANVQIDTNGVRHHQITIPYEQFLGGKTELAVQFLPGARYSEPTVMIEGFDLDSEALVLALTSTDEPTAMDHSWMDVYITKDLSMEFPNDGKPDYFTNYRMTWAGDSLYSNENSKTILSPAVEFGLKGQVSGDFVLVPEAARFAECVHPLLIDSTVQFMHDNMLNPDTGLVDGVWDFAANNNQGSLIATDRITSNILLVNDLGYGRNRDMIDFDNPENEAFLKDLLVKAINQEIVLSPNGQWVFAPGGIIDSEMIIELKNLSISITYMYKELRQTDLELADKLLEGFANTLQLVLEAQEKTPANLISSMLMVKYNKDGSYSFTNVGNFNMEDEFYGFWLNTFNRYHLSEEINSMDIFNGELLDYISSWEPEDQKRKMIDIKEGGERFDNVNRIPIYIYRILYNIYAGRDGNYAQYYSVEDGTPVIESIKSSATVWSIFRQHYGSLASLSNWMSLAGFFNDDEMLSDTYPIIKKGIEILSTYVFEPQFVDPEKRNDIFPEHYIRLWEEGFGNVCYLSGAWNGDNSGLTAYNSTATIPWGMNGALAWRITFDEYLSLVEEKYDLPFSDLPQPTLTP